MCTCEGCGQPYNPNRHKKCGTQGCDTLFSHHPHFYKQTKKSKDSAETERETEKLITQEKLKKKVDGIRWRRVLQDSRAQESVDVRSTAIESRPKHPKGPSRGHEDGRAATCDAASGRPCCAY